MTSFAKCIRLQDFSKEDLAEIRGFIKAAGGSDVKGIRSYLNSLAEERASLKEELNAIIGPEAKKEATIVPPQVQQGGNGDDKTTDQRGSQTVELADHLSKLMISGNGMPKDSMALTKMASKFYGGTIAEGAFSPKEAYDALELAANLVIQNKGYDPSVEGRAAKIIAERLQNFTNTLPTQTRRDTETDAFQQFSTPPAYGFAANWIANIQRGEHVLEPSAGNGGIAVFAQNAGADVDVNELAERRVPTLKALDFDRVTTENAEQIGNIWANDKSRTYDVVVMNPPFSASAGRTDLKTSATGAKHIQQALSVLKPGGRLVAIMGHTFKPGNKRLDKFFKSLDGKATVRANVEVNGNLVYKKYGTTYDNRILVIDKVSEVDGSEILGGRAETIPELIEMMEDIRNDADNRSTKADPDADDGRVADRDTIRQTDEAGREPGAGKSELVSKPDDLGREGVDTKRPSGSDPEAGRAGRSPKSGKGSDGRRKPNTDDAGKRADRGSGTTTTNRGRPSVRVIKETDTVIEEDTGGFSKYKPSRIRIEGAVEHPMLLVESSAMASVNPPAPDYQLHVPEKMITKGLLSEAQLEAVVYAGAAHSEMLPSENDKPAKRKGYYIGDSTGVGKTREIAGIISDNWAQGRKKHILISKDKKLMKGARRDFDNVGMKSVPIADLGATKADGTVPKKTNGVLFATYSTIGRSPTAGKKSRLEQIIEWVGKDFDGTIIFDEAHLAGNAMPIKGKRGTTKPSATALAVVELQNELPNARVVYASATAATEVYNLAYADRLGLWGPGTPFPTVESFVTQVDKGGIAAMEVVARDMKQMGVYTSRSLSFEGVEYNKVEHELTPEQRGMYDAAAEAWQIILGNISKVVEEHTEGGGRQRGAALAQFWGSHQRFFQQVLTSMQMPTVLKSIEKDMKAGLSPVIQIVNTNEAATKRAMAKLEDGDTLDDIDITPREDMMQYLETSFPIHQYEDYSDDNGNIRQRPVQDSKGNFVVNAEAVRIRDEMMGKLGSIVLPGNPLDMIISKFGPDKVAEVTGRSLRIIEKDGKKVKERRSQNKALAEVGEFQGGKRELLIFSDAGGTGMDFHADKDVKNTKRRSHYVLQAGWRADRAIQGFGRTHRTNQVEPPVYKLAGTNLSGHKRFTSSIARRLDQLGALTKGQKEASGSGMFNATDNLENEFADTAVTALFYDIYSGKIEGFTAAESAKELGLNIVGESGFSVSKIPTVPQFLNRILNLTIDTQNMLFDRFIEHMETAVQVAIDNNEYTSGVEEVKHSGAVLVDTKEAYRDKVTDATSEYRMVKLTQKVEITPFKDMDKAFASIKYKKNRDTGLVYAFRPASSRTNDRGQVIPTYHRYSPTDRNIIDSQDYQFRYDILKPEEAEPLWNEQIKDAPETREETHHLVTGTLLPIWDRLPSSSPKIVRLTLDDGRTLLGREIPDVELTRTLENLGVTGPEIDMSAAEIQASVMAGKTVLLSSGHRLERRRVGGEQRIEIISPQEAHWTDTQTNGTLERFGFQKEVIQSKSRMFAVTSDKGLPAIEAFMQGKHIVNVTMEKMQAKSSSIDITTKAFKNWFGDSKVVDRSGTPMVVFHGTDADFDQFNPASFFAEVEDLAEGYGGELIPTYLSINNPATGADVIRVAQELPGWDADMFEDEYPGIMFNQIEGVMEALQSEGFDGATFDDGPGGWSDAADSPAWVAFSPKQVKSVDNRGTFDPESSLYREQTVNQGPMKLYRDTMPESRVYKSFKAELGKLGLSHVDIQFDPFYAHQGHIVADHFGKMMITIGNTLNPKWTLGHEAVHAYKHMGVFTRAEWAILETEADKWSRDYKIRSRYRNLSMEERREEAVAEAFGDAYTKGSGFKTSTPARAALKKIANFLKAVRNWSKGMGFKTADDVLEAMARGEFSKRPVIKDWESQTERLSKQQRRVSDIERTGGAMHIPDRYVWDTIIHGNKNLFARAKEVKGATSDRFDAFRVKYQDYFLPWLRAGELLNREFNGKVPEELDVYLTEAMYTGRVGHKLNKIREDFTFKIIDTIGNTKGMTVETVGQYLTARHAEERNNRIAEINPEISEGGSGMSTDEANSILKAIKDSPEGSAYEDIGKVIDELREQTIDERVEMGLITEVEAEVWKGMYENYVPLKGFAETEFSDASLDITGIGRGYNVRGVESRRAMGRKSEAFNPLIAAITQAEEVAVRGEKNRVGQSIYNLVNEIPAPAMWKVKRVQTKRVFNEATGLVEERSMSPITMIMEENEMAVKVDGVEHRITFNDQRLARSANRVGVSGLSTGLIWLSKFSRYFSAINTMLNPAFVVKNFVRDFVTANINIESREMATKIKRGMIKDLPKALAGAYRGMGGKDDTVWSKYYDEFSEAGGKVSFWNIDNPQANKKKVESLLRAKTGTIAHKSLSLLKPNSDVNPVLGALERINLAVDNAIRLSAFVHARKNGYSVQDAALLAKDLTVNFNRKGEYGSLINAAWTFSNAGFQGTHILLRALKARKVKAIVAGLVIISYLADQANTYLSDEDEDGQLYYDKLRDYRFEYNFILMLGLEGGKAQNAASIYLPYGYNVFPYLGNRISQVQRGKITPQQAIGDMASAVFNAFMPISGGDMLSTAAPTLVDPALELARNKNWLGWGIHPQYPSNIPNAYRDNSASTASRAIAQKINLWTGGSYVESGWADVYPDDIDYITGFLTGGLGRTLGQTADIFAKLANDEPVRPGDIPVVKDLYREQTESLTRSLYFDRSHEIEEAYQDARRLAQAGDPIPDHIAWVANLNDIRKEAARYYRGTKTVGQDIPRAYHLLNAAYVRSWKANTAYSSESIFD